MQKPSERLPVTHYMLGRQGFPVSVQTMHDPDHIRLTVRHWNKDVDVGDRMVIGDNPDVCMTYMVMANTYLPGQPQRMWTAELHLLSLKRGLPPALRNPALHPYMANYEVGVRSDY
jgi:hypothetical protein